MSVEKFCQNPLQSAAGQEMICVKRKFNNTRCCFYDLYCQKLAGELDLHQQARKQSL